MLLGDGYTADEMESFHDAVKRLTESLFSVEPFKSRRQDFNVRAIDVTATESGVSRPRSKLVLGFRKEWLAELEARLVDHELPRRPFECSSSWCVAVTW